MDPGMKSCLAARVEYTKSICSKAGKRSHYSCLFKTWLDGVAKSSKITKKIRAMGRDHNKSGIMVFVEFF